MADQSSTASDLNRTTLSKKVMVVDDDEDWIFIIRRMLKKAGLGTAILTAKNGLEAFHLLQGMEKNQEALPDLILLDIKMPVMDGFGLLQHLTTHSQIDLTRTKVYMCSSSASSADKEKAQNYPIAGFLTKPLSVEELQQVLN